MSGTMDISVRLANESMKKVYLATSYYGMLAFEDPFTKLFTAKNVSEVVDAIRSSVRVVSDDDDVAECGRQLEGLLDHIRQAESVAGVGEFKTTVENDGDFGHSKSHFTYSFAKYFDWSDRAEVTVSNWEAASAAEKEASKAFLVTKSEEGDGFAGAMLRALADEALSDGVRHFEVELEDGIGIDGALDVIDGFTAAARGCELFARLESVLLEADGRAIESSLDCWSIAGVAGAGWKRVDTIHGIATSESRAYGTTASFIPDYSERIGVLRGEMPLVCATEGRRVRKGVELSEGDPLLLSVNADGRELGYAGDSVDGEPPKGDGHPLAVKVKTIQGKQQGALACDEQTARLLALDVENLVAFVEAADPLQVRVGHLPGAALPNEDDVIQVAFRFVKKNEHTSSKRFKTLKGYERKLAAEG